MRPTRSATPSVPTDSDGARRATDRHAVKLERVVRQLRSRSSARPVSLKKKAVSHLVPKPRDKRHTDDKIDISDLDEILEIDPSAMPYTGGAGCHVHRPGGTRLHGLAPTIVPELTTITIGGAVAGCSTESIVLQARRVSRYVSRVRAGLEPGTQRDAGIGSAAARVFRGASKLRHICPANQGAEPG